MPCMLPCTNTAQIYMIMLSLPNLKRFLLWNICFPQCTFLLFFLLFGYIFCLLCALFVISVNTQTDTHAPHPFWGERVCVSACFHAFRVSGLHLFCLSALSLRRSVFLSLAYFLLVLCSSRTVSTRLVTFLFGLGSHLVGFVISVLLCASEVYAVHYGISYFVVCSHLSDIFLLMLKKSGVSLVVD